MIEIERMDETDVQISGVKTHRSRSRSGPKNAANRIITGKHNIVLQRNDQYIR